MRSIDIFYIPIICDDADCFKETVSQDWDGLHLDEALGEKNSDYV
jgi:hypothetical protein